MHNKPFSGSNPAISAAIALPFIALTLTIFSPNYAGALDFKWMGIAAMAMILLGMGALAGIKRSSITLDRLDWYAGAFFLYAAASLAWSPDPRGGAYFLLFFVPLWAIFTFFKNTSARLSGVAACHGVTIAAIAVMLIQLFPVEVVSVFWKELSQGVNSSNAFHIWGGFFNHNFLTEFLLMALPFMAATAWINRRAIYLWLPVTAAIGWILYFLVATNPSKIEFLVLPGALLAYLTYRVWRKHPRAALIGIAITIILSGLLATVLWDKNFSFAQNSLKQSLLPRLMLYWNVLFMWLDKPLFGHGAGGFEAAYPLYQELFMARWPELALQGLASKFKTAGAVHNEYLQFLVEFGLTGVVLTSMAAMSLIRAVRKIEKPDPVMLAAIAAICFGALNALIEFPLQMPSTALMIVIALGILANGARSALPATGLPLTRFSRPVFALFSLAIISSIAYTAYRYDAGQREFSIVYNLHDADPAQAYAHHIKALEHNPLTPKTRAVLYESLHQWNLSTGAPPLSPKENDAVFKRSLTAGPQELLLVRRVQYLLDTGRLKTDKAETERWLEHLKKHAFFRTDVWIADAYYQLLSGNREIAMKSLERARTTPHDPTESQLVLIAQDQQMYALYQMIKNPEKGHDRAFPLE